MIQVNLELTPPVDKTEEELEMMLDEVDGITVDDLFTVAYVVVSIPENMTGEQLKAAIEGAGIPTGRLVVERENQEGDPVTVEDDSPLKDNDDVDLTEDVEDDWDEVGDTSDEVDPS